MKNLTRIGIALSAAWIIAALVLLYTKRATLGELSLNSWGDFCAGFVAPLAFFWLVLGYIQQGEELRLNTAALLAQQQELQNQVRETAALVANAERQAAATEQLALATRNESQRAALKEEAESLPLFRPEGGSGSGGKIELNVKNVGATVKRLTVVSPPGVGLIFRPSELFQGNSTGKLVVESARAYPFTFTVKFHDLANKPHEQTYEMLDQWSFVELREA